MKKNKNIKPPEDPKIKIHPIDPGGSVLVTFN